MINKQSGYCPLDLFSGDEKRMQHSLNSLIDSPQNNFKLFVNQEIKKLGDSTDENSRILEDNGLDKRKLIDFLAYALNHSFNENRTDCEKYEHQMCKYHHNIHGLSSGKLYKWKFFFEILFEFLSKLCLIFCEIR